MSQSNTRARIRTIAIIGLFAALSYVALYLMIPVPSPVGNPFLHLGNMFVILAALLFSGPVGGLSGAIGMGLWDLVNGYMTSPLSIIKTPLLKFGIGITVGAVASRGRKENAKSPMPYILAAGIVLTVVGIALGIYAPGGAEIAIEGAKKPLTLSPVLYIFSLILGILLIAAAVCARKISVPMQYNVLGAVAGIVFNLLGEFVFGVISLLIAGSAFAPALIASVVSLPATLINGTASIVIAVLLYMPLSRALKSAHLL